MNCNAIKYVSFDMMQNELIPKLVETDTFYSKEIWLYNFYNSAQTSGNCHLYIWVESGNACGPNELFSMLLKFLEKLEACIKKY